MSTHDAIVITLIFSNLIMLFVAVILLRRKNSANGSFSSHELLRRFSECLQQNESLNRRIGELERELQQLQVKLAEAESEIAALRALLVRVARVEFFADETESPERMSNIKMLREERDQLQHNIEQLRLHIARYGDDIFVQNRLEATQKRLEEVERALDRAKGVDVGGEMR